MDNMKIDIKLKLYITYIFIYVIIIVTIAGFANLFLDCTKFYDSTAPL